MHLKKMAGASKTDIVLSKADPVKRIIAFVIDCVIASMFGILPVFGGIMGALYLLFRDALPIDIFDGKSVGKKLINLRLVMRDHPSAEISYAVSAKRNWMFALNLLVVIPIFGWLLAPFILFAGVFLAGIECFRIFADKKGLRMGDIMAGTMIIEG